MLYAFLFHSVRANPDGRFIYFDLSQQRFQVYSVRTRHPLLVKQNILIQAANSSPRAHTHSSYTCHMCLPIWMRPPQTYEPCSVQYIFRI